jgi:hypothetical protein
LLYPNPLFAVGLLLILIHREVLLVKLVRVDVKVRIVLVLVILLILITSIILRIIGGAPLLSMVFFGSSLGLGVVLKDFRALSIRCNLRKLLGLGLPLSLFRSRGLLGGGSRSLGSLFLLPVFLLLAGFVLELLHPQFDLLDLRLDRTIPDISIGWLREALDLAPDLLDHAISGRYGDVRYLRREILVLEPGNQLLPLFQVVSRFLGLLVHEEGLGIDDDATLCA